MQFFLVRLLINGAADVDFLNLPTEKKSGELLAANRAEVSNIGSEKR